MRKVAFLLAFLAVFASGCRTSETSCDKSCGTVFRRQCENSFNQEVYVWQDFNFTTNRVQEVVK